MAQSEIEAVRALLSSKPRPVRWPERRRRLDDVGSIWPVADDVKLTAIDVDGVPGEYSIVPGSKPSRDRAAKRLQEAALSEISEIFARRALDQVDREFEQANFPRVVHTLDDGAERFVFIFDPMFRAIDHRVDRISQRLFGYVGFAKLKSVTKHGDVPRMLA